MNKSAQILFRWLSAALILLLASTVSAVGGESMSLCASAEQLRAVRELYARSAPPTFAAAPQLGMPEAVVLSALGRQRAAGAGRCAVKAYPTV